MKGIGKILIGVIAIVGLMLSYVHGQIALFHLSYDLDTKSESVTRLNEEYRHLKFEVDQLKTPAVLEKRIEALGLKLTLPKEIRVIQVPAKPVTEAPIKNISSAPLPDRFMSFLGRWVDVAQAKTES